MKNKKLITLFLVLIALIAAGYFLLTNKDKKEQQVLESTYDISKEYLLLHLRTDDLLVNAEKYPEYSKWDEDMTKLIQDWENLEKKSQELESTSGKIAEEVAFNPKLILTAEAYTAKEINAIYDKAPRFKGIATLAKHLGVDAKRAQLILNQAQDETTAEGWTEAGDTLQKLETSAVVIKDGCKVAGYVGGVVITGGAAGGFAAVGTLTQVTTVVVGVDLALEVTEDSAQIALGDKNKISSFVKDVRTVTEPVASVLTITNIPNNLGTAYGKFESVMVGLDQLRESAQEGKVVGIDLKNFEYHPPFQVIKQTKYPGELTVAEMDKAEVEEWLQSLNVKQEPMSQEEIKEFLENSDKKTDPGNEVVKQENNQKTNDDSNKEETNTIVGTRWKGTLSSVSGGDNQKRSIDFDFTLNQDGSVTGTSFKKWKQDGDVIRVYGEDESVGYYEFKTFKEELQLTKIVLGDEVIQPGESYMGGIAPGGFLQKTSGSNDSNAQGNKDAMPFSEFNELSDDGEFKNIAMVTEKLGEPDVKTTDDKGRIIYIYYDLVKYDSGNLGSVKMSFYNEEQYRSYIEGMGVSWESNKENWDVSGGGIRASEEIKPKDTFKSIYGE
jgi:hypothetical protein